MKMLPIVGLFALAMAWLAASYALAAPDDLSSGAPPAPSVALVRVVSSIPPLYLWAIFEKKPISTEGGECLSPRSGPNTLSWNGNSDEVSLKAYLRPFAQAMKAAGLSATDDPDNLFQKGRGASDLAVAANIKDIKATLCAKPVAKGRSGESRRYRPLDVAASSGKVQLTVDWELYSRSRDKVLFRKKITSEFEIKTHADDNVDRLVQGAAEENIKAYVTSPEFKSAVLVAAVPASFQVQAQPILILTGASTRTAVKISDAVGSVVLILSGGGHGSGFLASTDGYVMTAAHVVGSDKYVKIRWSDGLEGVGEVVRTDKRRDVALIKVDPRNRQPLALRREAPQPGDTVFAIGAPIDPQLQSTVTRGVASANRILDGFSFIQSDVTVDPGNSGGPLLNEKGEVLGFTDKGLRTAEAPTGLNFFVPIDDALRFLSAEPR